MFNIVYFTLNILGTNRLTLCDVEFIFHRNLKRIEDELYLETGVRKLLRRLPLAGVSNCLVDFAKIRQGITLSVGNGSSHPPPSLVFDQEYLDELTDQYITPLVYRIDHGAQTSPTSPTTSSSAEFWYDRAFKARLYKRDVLTFVTNQIGWLKDLFARFIYSPMEKKKNNNIATTRNFPPGITPKAGRTTMKSTRTQWEEVLGTGKSHGLFMSQETYLECFSAVGVLPALVNKKLCQEMFQWITLRTSYEQKNFNCGIVY